MVNAEKKKRFWEITRSEKTALICAFSGAIIYLCQVFSVTFEPEARYFGQHIYDQYYAAIMDGRMDLPVRVVRFEGHYVSDGTAFLYHGVAPLLTRFLFGWFLPLETMSLTPFSIWLWAAGGTALFHKLLHDLAVQQKPELKNKWLWSAFLGIMIWLATPGLLLANNGSFYHETSAVAFFVSTAFLVCFARYSYFALSPQAALILMAGFAAVCLHARPNIAIGLVAGAGLFCLVLLFRHGRQIVLPGVFAALLIATSLGGYFGLNHLKFGNLNVTHGSFSESSVMYGSTFWGVEPGDGRAEAFVEHGKFNAKRILPNFGMYAFDPPQILGATVSEKALKIFRSATEQSLGFIRLESPRVGFFFLWLPWLYVIVWGLIQKPGRQSVYRWWPVITGTGIAFLLTLSYGTITFRYRFDLWPFIAAFVVAIWPVFVSRFREFSEGSKRLPINLAVLIALQSNLVSAVRYSQYFPQVPQSFFMSWSKDFCVRLAVQRGFDQPDATRICKD